MMTGILLFLVGGFLLGGLLLLRASRGAAPRVRRQRAIKYLSYFLIVAGFCAMALAGRRWLTVLVITLILLGFGELARVYFNAPGRTAGRFLRWMPAALIFLGLGAATLHFVAVAPPETVVYVYLVTATFDGFSQVSGQLAGRRLLARRLSPNKTVEGFMGGLLAGCLAAILLRGLGRLSLLLSLGSGAVIGLSGLAGDLAASWVKRRNGAKDFGTLLPGHGGILDRFDSFFLAAPAYLLYSLACRSCV